VPPIAIIQRRKRVVCLGKLAEYHAAQTE